VFTVRLHPPPTHTHTYIPYMAYSVCVCVCVCVYLQYSTTEGCERLRMLLGRYKKCLRVLIEKRLENIMYEDREDRKVASSKTELTELDSPIESKGGFVISDRNSWLSVCCI